MKIIALNIKEAGMPREPKTVSKEQFENIFKHLKMIFPDVAEKFQKGELSIDQAKQYLKNMDASSNKKTIKKSK